MLIYALGTYMIQMLQLMCVVQQVVGVRGRRYNYSVEVGRAPAKCITFIHRNVNVT